MLNITEVETVAKPFEWIMLAPYAVVIVTALCGMNVLPVLLLGMLTAWGLGVGD